MAQCPDSLTGAVDCWMRFRNRCFVIGFYKEEALLVLELSDE